MLRSSDEMTRKWGKLPVEMFRAKEEVFGAVVNTFEEVENEYAKNYIKAKGK